MVNNLVPECTGWCSKLMTTSAWVRLNFTTEHFTDEQLGEKAKLFLMNELSYRGRSQEIKSVNEDWYIDRIKAAVPLFGRNTALVYLKKGKKNG
jgi:hypothetical protein